MKNSKPAVRKCADQLKILADETRLMILREIKLEAKTVTEINKRLKIDQSLLSHHLKILKDADFVKSVRSGKFNFYKASLHISEVDAEAIDLGCCILNFN